MSSVDALHFAFDRQLLLADLIGDLPWVYNLRAGILSFGDRYHWKAEVLGTESEESRTWLWAWANEASNIPAQQQTASLRLKTLGEGHGIDVLTEPVISLEHGNGHAFASIAVGEGLGKAYYRGPYVGGAVFLLITDERLQFNVDEPLQRILAVFPQAISAMEIADHREALRSYLKYYGLEPVDEDNALILRRQGRELLRAEFDEFGRLRELKGTLEHSSRTEATLSGDEFGDFKQCNDETVRSKLDNSGDVKMSANSYQKSRVQGVFDEKGKLERELFSDSAWQIVEDSLTQAANLVEERINLKAMLIAMAGWSEKRDELNPNEHFAKKQDGSFGSKASKVELTEQVVNDDIQRVLKKSHDFAKKSETQIEPKHLWAAILAEAPHFLKQVFENLPFPG